MIYKTYQELLKKHRGARALFGNARALFGNGRALFGNDRVPCTIVGGGEFKPKYLASQYWVFGLPEDPNVDCPPIRYWVELPNCVGFDYPRHLCDTRALCHSISLVTLIDSPNESKSDSRFPHKCNCGAPAYIGIVPNSIDCSSAKCNYYRG